MSGQLGALSGQEPADAFAVSYVTVPVSFDALPSSTSASRAFSNSNTSLGCVGTLGTSSATTPSAGVSANPFTFDASNCSASGPGADFV